MLTFSYRFCMESINSWQLFLVGSSITTLLVPVRLVLPFSRYITDLCNEYNLNIMDLQPRLTSKKRSLGQKRDSVWS